MITSKEWWDKVKNDRELFNEWLIKQYRGEVTAAARIREFALQYAPWHLHPALLTIADQEEQHAEWVRELLDYYGVNYEVLGEAEARYWKETLPEINDFESGSAVAAHSEEMRLERIRTIVNDENADPVVRQVFRNILVDELWHAKTFRRFAGGEAYQSASGAHARGLEALGLVM